MITFKKQLARITGVALLSLAGVAHAQVGTGGSGSETGTVGGLISTFLSFVNDYLVPLIFAIASLLFLWGVFRYFIAGGDSDENRKEGRTFILYAIIGFVVMVSVWGIVNLIDQSLGFDNGSQPPFPTINQGTGGSTCVSTGCPDGQICEGNPPVCVPNI